MLYNMHKMLYMLYNCYITYITVICPSLKETAKLQNQISNIKVNHKP